jgi:hypothetical protein
MLSVTETTTNLSGPRARAPRRWHALAAPLALAGALTMLAPAASASAASATTSAPAAPAPAAASAASCQNWVSAQPPSPGTGGNNLSGVTVLSGCNAWAVGSIQDGSNETTLIEHWNGATWTVVPSPSPSATFSELTSVRAVSGSDIWAVGDFDNSANISQTLILHWNGSAWKQVPSPSPGSSISELLAVRTVSANDAWAVGSFADDPTTRQSLTLHWNGRAWRQVSSPHVGPASSSDTLSGVAATSGHDVWAVGTVNGATSEHTLILHWNGTRWTHVASQNPGTFNTLRAVAVVSPSDAWAVGAARTGPDAHTLVLHWNGRAWSRVASPSPGGTGFSSLLTGVTATSAGNALAVGNLSLQEGSQALILHWNGRTWGQVTSPGSGSPTPSRLSAVAAASAGNAWAVGQFDDSALNRAFAIHCC